MRYLKLYNKFNESIKLNDEVSNIIDSYKRKINDCFLQISDIYDSKIEVRQLPTTFTIVYSISISKEEFINNNNKLVDELVEMIEL